MKYRIIKTTDYYNTSFYSISAHYGSRKIIQRPRYHHIKSKISEDFLETDYQIRVGDIVENAVVVKINICKYYIEIYCKENIYQE